MASFWQIERKFHTWHAGWIEEGQQLGENVKQIEDKLLVFVNDKATPVIAEWTDCLSDALKNLSTTERELVQWLFIEGFSLAEYAE